MDEARVIERAREGDTEAFESILERYEKPVFNAAYRIVANYEDAADVTQTVFLKVHQKLGSYRPEHKFFSWIYRIAVNEVLMTRRRQLPEVGKRLSERLGISATALGLFILSIVTSLPELAVTLAACAPGGAPVRPGPPRR